MSPKTLHEAVAIVFFLIYLLTSSMVVLVYEITLLVLQVDRQYIFNLIFNKNLITKNIIAQKYLTVIAKKISTREGTSFAQ